MCGTWGDLVWNTNLLHQLLGWVQDTNVQAQHVKMEKDLVDTEFSVAMLGMKLGKCTESMGTDNVYGLIEDLSKDVIKLQQVVCHLDSLEAESNCQNKIETAIGSTILCHLQPLVGLFQMLLSMADSPSDLLEQCPPMMGGSEGSLQPCRTYPGMGESSFSRVTWAISRHSSFGKTWQRHGGTYVTVGIKDMQVEMMAASVKVGTLTFVSHS